MRMKTALMTTAMMAVGSLCALAPAMAYDTSQSNSAAVTAPQIFRQSTVTTTTTVADGYLNRRPTRRPRPLPPRPQRSDIDAEATQTSSLFRYGATGLSAQQDDPRAAVWGQYGYTRFDEDQTAIDSDGSSHAFAVGGDYRWNNWLATGMAFVYSRTDVDTTFNRGTSKSSGYTFAPYAVVSVIPSLLIADATVGYTVGDNDMTRSNGAITGSTDTNSYFASANLSLLLGKGPWSFTPSTGILWSRSEVDAFRESNGTAVPRSLTHFGRMHIGSEVGYNFERWSPFVGAKYLYDYKFEHAKDPSGVPIAKAHKSAAELSMGANVSLTNRLIGSFKGTTEAFRKDNSTYSFSGSLRYAF